MQFHPSILLILRIGFIVIFLLPNFSYECWSGSKRDQAFRNSADSLVLNEIDKPSLEVNSMQQNIPLQQNEIPGLSTSFIYTYLKEFGYFTKDAPNVVRSDLQNSIRNFQSFVGLTPSGIVDSATKLKMVQKRCANKDIMDNAEPVVLRQGTVNWALDSSVPPMFSTAEMKELINRAFSTWEIVIALNFVQVNDPSAADIVFTFDDPLKSITSNPKNDPIPTHTGLGVASTSYVNNVSWISLRHDEQWSTFQVQQNMQKLDIFLVLIHEIGHALGLKHFPDPSSVMYPIFERPIGQQLPVISFDDVEILRRLYANGGEPTEISAFPSRGISQNEPEKCPQSIWAATAVNGLTVLFKDKFCWFFKNGVVTGPFKINEIFNDGPEYVDVAISSSSLTVLIKERMLFGYTYQETTGFRRAHGFPHMLHNFVLFYPRAAFPLGNGSVILIRDSVFATYDLVSNTPSMLNDKNVFFPNLPDDLRSGIPSDRQFSSYQMLTSDMGNVQINIAIDIKIFSLRIRHSTKNYSWTKVPRPILRVYSDTPLNRQFLEKIRD